VPGISLYSADFLFRFPFSNQPTLIESSDIIEQYMSVVTDVLSLSDVATEKVKDAAANNYALCAKATFGSSLWPPVKCVAHDFIPYWHS
jgi:hypothetical protein